MKEKLMEMWNVKTKIFQLAIETLGLVTSVLVKWIHQISESRISISIQESAILRVRSSVTTKAEEDKSLARVPRAKKI